MKRLLVLCACVALTACSGSNNGGSNNGGSNNGGSNNTTGTNNDTTTTNNNTAGTNNNTTTTNNNTAGTNNNTMGPVPVHGCTSDEAQDRTGEAAVSITDIDGWEIGHKVCLKVSTGTVVSWSGNFTFHPLAGGVLPTQDAASPITTAGSTVTGDGTVDVTFDTAGDYPYFCTIHTSSMSGVVYVVD